MRESMLDSCSLARDRAAAPLQHSMAYQRQLCSELVPGGLQMLQASSVHANCTMEAILQ